MQRAAGRRFASSLLGLLALCALLQHACAATNVIRPAVDVEPGSKEKPAAGWAVSAVEQSAADKALKQQSLTAADRDVMLAAARTGALLPACVPKYVTDLFVPPPMPVASSPLAEAMARRRYDAPSPSRRLQGAARWGEEEDEEGEDMSVEVASRRYPPTYRPSGAHARRARHAPSEEPASGRYSRSVLEPQISHEDVEEVQQVLSSLEKMTGTGPRAEPVKRGAAAAEQEQAAAEAPVGEEADAFPLKPRARGAATKKRSYNLDEDYWSTFYGVPSREAFVPGRGEQTEEVIKPVTPKAPPTGKPAAEQKQKAAAAPEQQPQQQQPPAKQEPGVPASTQSAFPVDAASGTYVGYDISVKQVTQDVLPQAPVAPEALPGCPAFFKQTNVYAYGPANVPGTPFHNWPGFTIEAQRNVETRVRWTNDLLDSTGMFQTHMLKDSLDQTLPWANPQALGGESDISPCAACSAAGPGACAKDTACVQAATSSYTGPVPVVTHLHGQVDVSDFSDGYPEAWYLPKARNLLGYKLTGSWHQTFKREYAAATGTRWNQGTLTSQYRNTQRPAALWYRDNALGISRLNKYAGLSGFYMLRERFPSLANGPEMPGLPYPAFDGVTDLSLVRELPLAIQDRAFTNDSQLWFPVSGLPTSETLPAGPAPPRWLPELLATVNTLGVDTNMLMMTVNGRTYPRHTIYPDAYRLRLLNGCNTRTLQLRLAKTQKPFIDPLKVSSATTLLPFYVVGGDAGFFPQMQTPVTTLEMGPGERFDVVVDFSGVMPSEYVFLLNNGPEPDTALYDGTNNGLGLTEHTAQVMRFDVQPMPADQTLRPFTAEQQYQLNTAMLAQWAASVPPLANATAPVKRIALLSQKTADGNPVAVSLGTVEGTAAKPLLWTDAVAAKAAPSDTQFYDVINLSDEAHPIHLQGLNFRYIGRWEVTVDAADPNKFTETDVAIQAPDLDTLLQVQCGGNGAERCPVPKDTMLILPKTRTRIAMIGPQAEGLHMLQHEGSEMMLPFCIGSPQYNDPRRPGQLMCGPKPTTA